METVLPATAKAAAKAKAGRVGDVQACVDRAASDALAARRKGKATAHATKVL